MNLIELSRKTWAAYVAAERAAEAYACLGPDPLDRSVGRSVVNACNVALEAHGAALDLAGIHDPETAGWLGLPAYFDPAIRDVVKVPDGTGKPTIGPVPPETPDDPLGVGREVRVIDDESGLAGKIGRVLGRTDADPDARMIGFDGEREVIWFRASEIEPAGAVVEEAEMPWLTGLDIATRPMRHAAERIGGQP